MSEKIEFVKNFNDHSTDTGFQFEFICDKCGASMAPGAKFCPECGAKVGGE